MGEITIRQARSEDAEAIERLAVLDESAAPRGAALLGFVDGELAAARSLTHSHTVADPFVRTADLVALLDLRARQGMAS